jgi:uncharacterized Fe-S cluster-containing radical SAM superfamily protein
VAYDPLQLAKETEKITVEGPLRKYYRTNRPGKWYGGIATADCCGCNLRCVFCWSGAPRDNPEGVGRFHSPEQIFSNLTACAKKSGYEQLRISGNEPTISKDHLLKLLELVDQTAYKFILETNGILIGHDTDYARRLSRFRCVHVRVSIKGTNQQEFSLLTRAMPGAFQLQLKALENLLSAGVSSHPAVMLSFSSEENFRGLLDQLREIDDSLAENVEEEYVILYPHVVDRLIKAGIKPGISYKPNKVPKELV